MKKEDLFEYHENFTENCLELLYHKNEDYNNSEDALGNFKACKELGIKPEQGLLTRMLDKIKRVSSFVDKGYLHVHDEKVQDSLEDLVNYSIILSALISENNQQLYSGNVDLTWDEYLGITKNNSYGC